MVCLEEYQPTQEEAAPTKEEWQAPEYIPAWQLVALFVGIVLMLCGSFFAATHEDRITAVNTSNQ
jgi:hypothetical protein